MKGYLWEIYFRIKALEIYSIMNKKDIYGILDQLYWDIKVNRDDIYNYLTNKKALDDETKKRFFIRLLTGLDWYTIISLLDKNHLREALSDSVINILFPKSLRTRYLFARRLLFR